MKVFTNKTVSVLLNYFYISQSSFFKISFTKKNTFFNKVTASFLCFALFTGAYTKLYATVTLTSSPVAVANINQGTNNNIVCITKMAVTTTAVTVNKIQFTLGGTHDANDLTTVLVYFNATSPVFSGSSFLGSATATFAAPHAYSINISRAMAVGSSGYFIILSNVSSTATDNKTIKLNGATTPVTFGFTVAPTVVNSQTDAAGTQTIQAADINTVSSAVPAANLNQGTNNNIVYIAKMAVAVEPVTVNKIQFTLSGTHDANDLTTVLVYFNATSPVFSGSSFLGSAVATFAAPHAYSINISRAMAVGSSGYFIILANVSSTATDNKTIKINGATTPVTFGFTTAPNIGNGQTDVGGLQTIQAADINTVSSSVPAANLNQGTNNNIVYIAKMAVAVEPVTVNSIQFTLTGTHDANDLTTVLVYFNATSPVFSGSSFLGSAVATFATPHAYSINISRAMSAGSSGYFIILANVSSTATDNKTVKINGATTPVTFGFTTAPNIGNGQTDIAGLQTIQAADINTVSSAVPAANLNQGTNNNIVYIAKMAVAVEPVTVNKIQFTLSGTYDANDLTTVLVYFNATSPVFSGSSFLGSAVATFAAPHAYSINISRAMSAGSSGYFIILANVSSTATDNKTIKINGLTTPVTFGFTTAPNFGNNQTDVAGLQTIQAADINTVSSAVPAANLNQGTNNNIVYIAKMAVAVEPVTVNSIQFTLSGTHDANDLTTVLVYFNATSPVFSGSSFLGSAVATFAAPHAYSINISRAMSAGSSGYFIILANVSSTATDNKTIKINGLTTPVTFGFTTAPNFGNNQTDVAGLQTIQAADINIVSSSVAAGNVSPGTNNNIVYIAKMAVAVEPVTVNSIQFTLSGTHDANDLTTALVYFNATSPVFSGSSFLGSAAATFVAPHAYSINISRAMSAGSSGYFIILVNVSSTATQNNTIKVNGATNPVVFGFTTVPNVGNSQTDAAGTKTIHSTAGRNVDIITGNLPAATASGTDSYIVTATSKNAQAAYSYKDKLNVIDRKEDVSIYPNPAVRNSPLNLELQNLEKGTYTITVYNIEGKPVLKQTIKHTGGNTLQRLALPGIMGGMYTVEISNRITRFGKKLVIQ